MAKKRSKPELWKGVWKLVIQSAWRVIVEVIWRYINDQ